MNLDIISEICNELIGVTTDIKWGNDLCFNIGGKMFLILSLERVPTSASIKVKPDDFDALLELEGVKPAAYLARYKWISIDNIERFSKAKWKELINDSYSLVAAKLPKKTQRELNLI